MAILKYAILIGGIIKVVSAATKKIIFRFFHRHEILKNDKVWEKSSFLNFNFISNQNQFKTS